MTLFLDADARTAQSGLLARLVPLTVGSEVVQWLPAAAAPPPEALRHLVHPADLAAAGAPPALSSRMQLRYFELLRSRAVVSALAGERVPLAHPPGEGPRWPPPWRGSISHKDGHVAALLRTNPPWLSAGVDLETVDRVHDGLLARICPRPAEARAIATYAARWPEISGLALAFAFAMKEALFKCHHPVGGRAFYFPDAELIDLAPGLGDCVVGQLRLHLTTTPLTPAGSVVSVHGCRLTAGHQALVLTVCLLNPA